MLMICGMYQLFGQSFVTVEGQRVPGLGILDATTQGNAVRMIGPVVLSTQFGDVVGYENHSGVTRLGPAQTPLGTVVKGAGNNGEDGTEGARVHHVVGSYLHGSMLPKNPAVADHLIRAAVERSGGAGARHVGLAHLNPRRRRLLDTTHTELTAMAALRAGAGAGGETA